MCHKTLLYIGRRLCRTGWVVYRDRVHGSNSQVSLLLPIYRSSLHLPRRYSHLRQGLERPCRRRASWNRSQVRRLRLRKINVLLDSDGQWVIRQRLSGAAQAAVKEAALAAKKLKTGTSFGTKRFFRRGLEVEPQDGDTVVCPIARAVHLQCSPA